VEYLGNIVSKDLVRVDPKKVVATQDSPRPKTLKRLHGFLVLICYYIKFVKNYVKIVAPFTSLLRKNAFVWSEVAEQAFSALKDAMCTTPVLVVPDFTNIFVLECDAFGRGLGAVLMQEGHPFTFTSKQLWDYNFGKSTYDK
jgi:hypothetical protein